MTRANAALETGGCKFSGFPAAGFDQSMVAAAAKRQVVDVGCPALGVAGDMVDLAVVAGYLAAGV